MVASRKVLDISYAKDSNLASWLRQNKQHQVVLTEYFAIEALNAQDSQSVAANFDIVRRFPRQVLVAKPMNPLCQLAPKQLRKQSNLIDGPATTDFARLARQIGSMHRDTDIRLGIENRMDAARNYLENLSPAGEAMKDVLSGWLQTFRPADVKALRKTDEWTLEFRQTFLKNILEQAGMMLERAGSSAQPISLQELLFSMNFAFPVCFSIRAVHRSAKGDPRDISFRSHRSDLIDSTYCTLALYFDGILTHDAGAQRTFNDARQLIRQLKHESLGTAPIEYQVD